MPRKPRQKTDPKTSQQPSSEEIAPPAIDRNGPEIIKSAFTPPPITKIDGFRTMYANHSKIGVTQWDFVITFGQTTENSEGKLIIEENISIRFSPQYFKNFANTLLASVEQWEATFGEIQTGVGQHTNTAGMSAVFAGMKDFLLKAESQGISPNPSPTS